MPRKRPAPRNLPAGRSGRCLPRNQGRRQPDWRSTAWQLIVPRARLERARVACCDFANLQTGTTFRLCQNGELGVGSKPTGKASVVKSADKNLDTPFRVDQRAFDFARLCKRPESHHSSTPCLPTKNKRLDLEKDFATVTV